MNNQKKKGILIAAMGLPSVGKSSVIRELGMLLGCKTLIEKEESYWNQAISDRDKNHDFFTANMSFRCMRVPYYYEASRDVEEGKLVLLDTFYDKLSYLYMEDKVNFKWLFDDDSAYYNSLKEIVKLDYENLPDADYLIFFDIERDVWKKFMVKRGRKLDENKDFINSFDGIKKMKEAVDEYKKYLEENKKKLKIIKVKQKYDSANRIALSVFAQLLHEEEIVNYLRANNKINADEKDEYIKEIKEKYDPKDNPKNKEE